jgi:predicted DNA binding CopG/RHH family protein
MDKSFEKKVTSIIAPLTHKSYELFKQKCYSEGYSMQKAIQMLVDQYTNDKLVIKN